MRHEVKSYYAAWNTEHHTGKITLYWGPNVSDSNWLVAPAISDPLEFQVMIDLLRNESPVFFDPRTKVLSVGAEPVGEGEDAHNKDSVIPKPPRP